MAAVPLLPLSRLDLPKMAARRHPSQNGGGAARPRPKMAARRGAMAAEGPSSLLALSAAAVSRSMAALEPDVWGKKARGGSGIRHGSGAEGRGAGPSAAAVSFSLSAALPGHLLRGLLPLLSVFRLERAEAAARRAGAVGGDVGGTGGPPKIKPVGRGFLAPARRGGPQMAGIPLTGP